MHVASGEQRGLMSTPGYESRSTTPFGDGNGLKTHGESQDKRRRVTECLTLATPGSEMKQLEHEIARNDRPQGGDDATDHAAPAANEKAVKRSVSRARWGRPGHGLLLPDQMLAAAVLRLLNLNCMEFKGTRPAISLLQSAYGFRQALPAGGDYVFHRHVHSSFLRLSDGDTGDLCCGRNPLLAAGICGAAQLRCCGADVRFLPDGTSDRLQRSSPRGFLR